MVAFNTTDATNSQFFAANSWWMLRHFELSAGLLRVLTNGCYLLAVTCVNAIANRYYQFAVC